jgi:hypothetical protein
MTQTFRANRLPTCPKGGFWWFCVGAILLALLFAPVLRAQTPIYSYSEYWGVNGWSTAPYLPDTQLQISKVGNTVSVWWPHSISNAVLQTTTNLWLQGGWATLTNRPIESVPNNSRTITMLAQKPQQYFRLAGVATNYLPVFGFAIFHNGQLEFTQGPPLSIRGRTHANGHICMGAASGNTLTFSATVTTTSSIVVSNLGGYSGFATPIYNGTPKFTTNTPALKLPIGTNPSAAAVREIINLPPAGESATSAVGQQRFYHKAGIVLLVSNTTVTLTVKDLGAAAGAFTNIPFASASPSGADRTNLAQMLPFLSLTNRFYDYREGKWVMPTQIDMGKLKVWLTTNADVLTCFPSDSGVYPQIMYVADFRTLTNLHAVRVANGSVIPTNGSTHATAEGFTLATINPLYVWGNYNCPNTSHLGTTNTTQTFPAALICDAITILSTNWQDYTYGNAGSATYGIGGLSNRNAAHVTINAAIIAGTVFTTGTGAGNWSGGIQNLTRLLENWAGDMLTLNTSLVVLYNSARATNQFQNPGTYFSAPTRNFNFDQNFRIEAKLPPGTPVVVGTTPAN